MFETQINGVNQSVVMRLSTGSFLVMLASKINGGLDIINTFCEHYQVTATGFLLTIENQ
jgi:hypothetical protein